MAQRKYLKPCSPAILFVALLTVSIAAGQGTSFSRSDFLRLSVAVKATGKSARMTPRGATVLGIQVTDSLPCRQVHIATSANEAHSVESFSYGGRDYVALLRYSGNERWIFLVDEDGRLTVARHAVVHAGLNNLGLPDAQPLAAAEQAFWLQWLADGAKPPVSGDK